MRSLSPPRRGRALHKLVRIITDMPTPPSADAAVPPTVATSAPTAATSALTAAAAAGPPALTAHQFQRALMDVAMPLLEQALTAGGSGGGERAHDKKAADVDKEANVADAAVTALGAVAGRLLWPQYQQLLHHYVRLMGSAQPSR